MKSRIGYNRFSTILTAALFLLYYVGCFFTFDRKPAFFILMVSFFFLLICGVLYGPYYIQSTPDNIIMASIIRKRKIPMCDVESVERYRPTMGAVRIVASGGFMGYWGLFRDGGVGKYYAFYGKASNCFLVRMKNGSKFVLGCDDPDAMVGYIRSHIRR